MSYEDTEKDNKNHNPATKTQIIYKQTMTEKRCKTQTVSKKRITTDTTGLTISVFQRKVVNVTVNE